MRKKILTLFVLILAFNFTIVIKAESNISPYKIASMKAYLYYETSGTFSKNVFELPSGSLWNTVIGEGASGGASNSTMVVIEIKGTPGAYNSDRKLEFTAVENNRVILKKTSGIYTIGDKSQYFLAFWLYDVGMSPIKITARIIGQSSDSSVSKVIPFASGE